MPLSKQILVICAVSAAVAVGLVVVRGLPQPGQSPGDLGMCTPPTTGQDPENVRCQPELGLHVGHLEQSGPCPMCPNESAP